MVAGEGGQHIWANLIPWTFEIVLFAPLSKMGDHVPKKISGGDLNRPGFTGGFKDRINWSYGKEQTIEQIFT